MRGGSGNAAALTVYQLLFDLTDNLCQRYAALTPFSVRKERVGEVLLLVRRVNDRAARDNGAAADGVPRGNIRRDAKGNIHIRRHATDDMIF